MQVAAPVDFFASGSAGDLSGAASADEGRVLVIGFQGSPYGTRRRIPRANRVMIGSEFQFANQLFSPGLIDTGADFALHAFKLPLPRLSIRRQFQAAALASQRTRMPREGFANDRGPSARKPRHCHFGPIYPAERLAQEFSYSIHHGRDSNIVVPGIGGELWAQTSILRDEQLICLLIPDAHRRA